MEHIARDIGTTKYEAIGMPYATEEFYRPTPEELEHLKVIQETH